MQVGGVNIMAMDYGSANDNGGQMGLSATQAASNTHNQVVATIGEFLYRITEPLLRPIRSVLPNLGGIDVSPVILILLILFLENVIIRYIYPNVF